MASANTIKETDSAGSPGGVENKTSNVTSELSKILTLPPLASNSLTNGPMQSTPTARTATKHVLVVDETHTIPVNLVLNSVLTQNSTSEKSETQRVRSGPVSSLLKQMQSGSAAADRKAIADKLQSFISEHKSILEDGAVKRSSETVSSNVLTKLAEISVGTKPLKIVQESSSDGDQLSSSNVLAKELHKQEKTMKKQPAVLPRSKEKRTSIILSPTTPNPIHKNNLAAHPTQSQSKVIDLTLPTNQTAPPGTQTDKNLSSNKTNSINQDVLSHLPGSHVQTSSPMKGCGTPFLASAVQPSSANLDMGTVLVLPKGDSPINVSQLVEHLKNSTATISFSKPIVSVPTQQLASSGITKASTYISKPAPSLAEGNIMRALLTSSGSEGIPQMAALAKSQAKESATHSATPSRTLPNIIAVEGSGYTEVANTSPNFFPSMGLFEGKRLILPKPTVKQTGLAVTSVQEFTPQSKSLLSTAISSMRPVNVERSMGQTTLNTASIPVKFNNDKNKSPPSSFFYEYNGALYNVKSNFPTNDHQVRFTIQPSLGLNPSQKLFKVDPNEINVSPSILNNALSKANLNNVPSGQGIGREPVIGNWPKRQKSQQTFSQPTATAISGPQKVSGSGVATSSISESVYSTSLQTAQGSVPVMVVTPSLDEDSESDYEMGNILEEDTKWMNQLIENAVGSSKNSQSVSTSVTNLPESTSSFCAPPEFGSQPALQNFNVSPQPPDVLDLRIESVFSLNDSVAEMDRDNSSPLLHSDADWSTDTAESDCASYMTPVRTFNIAQSSDWMLECPPCYAVLERFSKSDLVALIEERSICSHHCRKRHLDTLCALGLLSCENKPGSRRNIVKPEHASPDLSKDEEVIEIDGEEELCVKTEDCNPPVSETGASKSNGSGNVCQSLLPKSQSAQNPQQALKFRLVYPSSSPIKLKLGSPDTPPKKPPSVPSKSEQLHPQCHNTFTKEMRVNSLKSTSSQERIDKISDDAETCSDKEKKSKSITNVDAVSKNVVKIPGTNVASTVMLASTAIVSLDGQKEPTPTSTTTSLTSMEEMKGFTQRLNELARQVLEKRSQMHKHKNQRKGIKDQANKTVGSNGKGRVKKPWLKDKVDCKNESPTKNITGSKLRSLLPPKPQQIRFKPKAVAKFPVHSDGSKVEFETNKGVPMVNVDTDTNNKLKSALNSLTTYISETGKCLTQGIETHFLIKVGTKHFLVKLPGSKPGNSTGNTRKETVTSSGPVSNQLATISSSDPLPTTTNMNNSISGLHTYNATHKNAGGVTIASPTGQKLLVNMSDWIIAKGKASVSQISGGDRAMQAVPQTNSTTTIGSRKTVPSLVSPTTKARVTVPAAKPVSTTHSHKQKAHQSLLIQTSSLFSGARKQRTEVETHHRATTQAHCNPAPHQININAINSIKLYADPSSALSHLPPNRLLLPEKKRPLDSGGETEEIRLMKRKKLEEKYPLPPGIVIKSEPDDDMDYHVETFESSRVDATATTPAKVSNIPSSSIVEQLVNQDLTDPVIVPETASEESLFDDFNDEPPPLISEVSTTKSQKRIRKTKTKRRKTSIDIETDEAPPVLEPMFPSTSSSLSSVFSSDDNQLDEPFTTQATDVHVSIEDKSHTAILADVDSGLESESISASGSATSLSQFSGSSTVSVSKPVSAQNLRIQRLKELLKKKEMEFENMRKMRSELPTLDLGDI